MCLSFRSRQELSNEYLAAKFGFDAAETEPLGIWNLEGNLGMWTGENSYMYSNSIRGNWEFELRGQVSCVLPAS